MIIKYPKLIRRFKTLKGYIIYPAIIFSLSIIIIEFKLRYIPAYNKFFYDLGRIYLYASYSYCFSFLFYFMVVHLPQEARKIKTYRYINNKTFKIAGEIGNMIALISNVTKVELDKQNSSLYQFVEACKKFNPHQKITSPYESNIEFADWFVYINYKGKKVHKLINDLIILNDAIDSDFLELLSFIDDEFSQKLCKHEKSFEYILEVKSLEIYFHDIYELAKNTQELQQIMKKKYEIYEDEYHMGARVRNIKRGYVGNPKN